MSRRLNPTTLGPAGVCDACGGYCHVLFQAGQPCFKCHNGTFIHRRFWVFSDCPFCAVATDPHCPVCDGTHVMATAREDIDPDDLQREIAEYSARH